MARLADSGALRKHADTLPCFWGQQGRRRWLRIAIVSAYFDESLDYFETTAAHWLARHNDVHVITSPFRSQTLTDANHNDLQAFPEGVNKSGNITVHRLPVALRQGQRVISQHVATTLRGLSPDLTIQIVPTQFFSLPATRYSRKTGTPVVVISGENRQQGPQVGLKLLLKKAYHQTVARYILRRTTTHAKRVVSTTPETAKFVKALSPRSDPKVIPLPFRSERYFPSESIRNVWRARLGIPDDGCAAAFIGRVVQNKRLEDILHAWDSASGDDENNYLVISGLGADPYSHHVRSLAQASRNADRIRLVDFVPKDDVNGLLNAVDISIWPAVSVGIQQAMATGCLVLIPANSPGSFLLNGQAQTLGLLYNDNSDGDPEGTSLASAVMRGKTLIDPGLRRTRADSASTLYSDSAIVPRLLPRHSRSDA